MRKVGSFLIASIMTLCATAQQPPFTTHWFSVQLPVVLSDRWQVLNEVSYRTLGEAISMNQLFLRTGARYRINPRWNMAACTDLIYTRVFPVKSDHHFGKEFRPWQEVNYQQPLRNNFFLMNRIRIEERFFAKTIRRDAFNAVRFRYRLGIGKDISDKWSIQVTDEIMEQVQDKKWDFNQNRISLGGTYQFHPTMQLQATYFWSQLPARSQHIFSLTFQKRILVHAK